MSNDSQPPVEVEQSTNEKPKQPTSWVFGCLSIFQTIAIILLMVQSVLLRQDRGELRDENEELQTKLWDALLLLEDFTGDDTAQYINEGKLPYLVREFEGDFSEVEAVAFSPDGQYLVSSHYEKVLLWDVQTGNLIRAMPNSDPLPSALAFSPDGQYIAAVGLIEPTVLWDVATGETVRTFGDQDNSQYVVSLAFSPDGR